jgi:cellulose biosynthesis protein BcsQ
MEEEKKYKIVILNAKGGVGKSTVAMQVVVPYLYRKNNNQPIEYYEFDDENEDSKSFVNSKLTKSSQIKVQESNLRDSVTDVVLSDNSACIDVGANKTTNYFLTSLIDSGMIHAIDLIVIPLADGELDAINAIELYYKVREVSKDVNIVFILNRYNELRDLNTQFDIFLGDKRGFFDKKGFIENILEEDRNYATLADSDAVKYCRSFGVTVWELATMQRDLDSQLKEALKDKKDKQTIKLLSFKRALKNDCELFTEKNLEPIFIKFDSLLIEKPTK